MPGPLKALFVGAHGIRAGWRLLFAFLLYRVLQYATGLARPWLPRFDGQAITPAFLLAVKTLPLFAITLTTVIASKAEHRPLGAYGVPLDRAAFRKLAVGAAWGAGMLTVLLVAIFPFHGIALTRSALSTASVVGYAVAWALAYLVLAAHEELLFRGYLQHTLTEGIGFWPAAVVTSLLFAAAHLDNPGETPLGLAGVVVIGLLFCLFLRRTGSLWFPIGFHCAWDYCESFVYGVPNSGITVQGHWLEAHLDGPAWLTGGSVGPEGSYLLFVAVGGGAALFFRRRAG